MNNKLTLLPAPRQLKRHPGFFSMDAHKPGNIYLRSNNPQKLLFTAQHLKTILENTSNRDWGISAAEGLPGRQSQNMILALLPDDNLESQGYRLEITSNHIRITGRDEAGIFYGVQTLKQIIQQSHNGLIPCLAINDWPDFPIRGVMLDISRDKVYRMETLLNLVEELASWKINQLQLYTEHTYAYEGHEIVWQTASPMKPEEILLLDRFCRKHFIDLVPNQNSFGHMTRWLKHPQYQHLAETTQPVRTPWGTTVTQPFSLAAVSNESLNFVRGLYDQLLPHFTSSLFNVGCDETFDLGEGKSRQACQELGKGKVYLNYLLKLYHNVKRRRLTMQFWGDIILQYPDLVSELPKDVIALDWGYEADHPFITETHQFEKAGVPYYVCPGTSSWNSIAGRVDNALENLKNAAENGLRHHAAGYLITDWGDNGHWQSLTISYPGLAAGAALSWSLDQNRTIDLPQVLNHAIFRDPAEEIGQILMLIGNEYKSWGLLLPNSSPLFWLLQNPSNEIQPFLLEDNTPIHETMVRLESSLEALGRSRPMHRDIMLIKEEIKLTIQLLQHACRRALWLSGQSQPPSKNELYDEINNLINIYRTLWLRRNRPGGLLDSVSRFNYLLEEYDPK
jgi:hypothetical protein